MLYTGGRFHVNLNINIWGLSNLIKVKYFYLWRNRCRGSHPEVFLGKGVIMKICSKFTGEQPCQSVISIKLFYWNRTSAWGFSSKLATYFQNTFSWENLWLVASPDTTDRNTYRVLDQTISVVGMMRMTKRTNGQKIFERKIVKKMLSQIIVLVVMRTFL